MSDCRTFDSASALSVRRRRSGGFVLIEVVIAMTIMATAMVAVMRGFTIGLKTLRQTHITAVGMTLAQRLLEEYEVEFPPPGTEEGHFGEAFPHFGWERTITDEEVEYQGARMNQGDVAMSPMYFINLKVNYFRSAEDHSRPIRAIEIDTAFTQAERFSHKTRMSCGIYPHD